MKIVTAWLFGICVSLGIILIAMVILMRSGKQEHKPRSFKNPFQTHRRKPVSSNDVRYITSWMTFDYITKVFNLPDIYLKESLAVDDARYPFLTLSDYSKKINTSDGIFVDLVKKSVVIYITSSSSTQR